MIILKLRTINKKYILYLEVLVIIPASMLHLVGPSGLYFSNFVIILLKILELNPLYKIL